MTVRDWNDLSTELLPQLLQDFVRLIGLPATMKMVEQLGGLRIYVPVTPTPDHQFVAIIGFDNLVKLSSEFGTGDRFMLPKATRALTAIRNARIVVEHDEKSVRTLASEYRLTERQVTRILSEARECTDPPATVNPTRQCSLFG